MRILFCSHNPLSKGLGAPKVLIELAEELRELGWACDLLSPADLSSNFESSRRPQQYSELLRSYLREHADRYDVVDYDHEHLPYPREEFGQRTLFVARSVLLVQHLETIPIPFKARGWRSRVGRIVKHPSRQAQVRRRVMNSMQTIRQADLVNVSNHDDKAELIRRGVPAEKIIVVPYGISRSRRPLFDAVPSTLPEKPVVAFVGTFDYRKGGAEFPEIAKRIYESVPQVRFRLIGTKGLFRTKREVLACFPKTLRNRIEVIPTFHPEELPELLAPCSVGIFPSYMEGFPFGVLEMLASSLPVVSYHAPGAPMMLPPEYLAGRGNYAELSDKMISLLNDRSKLRSARIWAKQQSQKYCWSRAAQITSEHYQQAFSNLCTGARQTYLCA